jgi:hypothetical protein
MSALVAPRTRPVDSPVAEPPSTIVDPGPPAPVYGPLNLAPVAESVDAPDSKSGGRKVVLVRVRPGAPLDCAMNLSVEIPDDLAKRLAAAGGDLSRRALEAFAIEEYRLGRLTNAELRRLLGFATRYELDGFLKSHGIFEPYSLDDLERERRDLQRLGF